MVTLTALTVCGRDCGLRAVSVPSSLSAIDFSGHPMTVEETSRPSAAPPDCGLVSCLPRFRLRADLRHARKARTPRAKRRSEACAANQNGMPAKAAGWAETVPSARLTAAVFGHAPC